MTTIDSHVVEFSSFANSKATTKVKTTLQTATDENISKCERDKNIGLFRILNQKDGDKRLIWNRMNMGDIAEAEKMFNEFVKQGLAAYNVVPGGKSGSRMERFDPTAEEVIFLPLNLVAGG